MTRQVINHLYVLYLQRWQTLQESQTQPYSANILNRIVELVSLCDRFCEVEPALFGLLGRVLMTGGRDDDAVIALVNQDVVQLEANLRTLVEEHAMAAKSRLM